jgi:hypothetical protein
MNGKTYKSKYPALRRGKWLHEGDEIQRTVVERYNNITHKPLSAIDHILASRFIVAHVLNVADEVEQKDNAGPQTCTEAWQAVSLSRLHTIPTWSDVA